MTEKSKQKYFLEDCDGEFIWNKNTGRLHHQDCGAIRMMNPENIVHQSTKNGDLCSWCFADEIKQSKEYVENHPMQEPLFFGAHDHDPVGTIECTDPYVHKIFAQTGCLRCGSHNYVIKMFPVLENEDGHRLKEHKGKWWIYAECQQRLNPRAKVKCGYQSAFNKALHRYNLMQEGRWGEGEEHATENGQ